MPANRPFTRREILLGAGGATIALVAAEVGAAEMLEEIADMKPGEFTWHPERQPTGPVAVVVSIPEQRVHVYRNGVRIAVSTCSTGKPGHATPTGVFVVLQKDKNHHSSTYNDAPMPNMNRLTWSGIALHAGDLPGYPASHGCVRLPMAFSANLFTVTHVGTPVIISGAASDPWELKHPGMVLGAYAESEFTDIEATLAGKKAPSDWTEAEAAPIVSVIASSSDRKIMMLKNSDVVANGDLTIGGSGPLGSHVFVLNGSDQAAKGMHWTGLSHGASAAAPESDVITRVKADPAFVAAMRGAMHPGLVLILTDAPLHPDTRTGADFVIMTHDDA